MIRVLRYSIITVLAIALINILPHIIVRLLANSNAVQVFETSGTPVKFNGRITIAAYNIAHGRGGKYGAKNWTEESPKDRESRLISMAKFLKKNDVDIVVLNEVDFNADWSHNQNQAEIIARHANFPYRVEQRNYDAYHPFFRLQFGNAVLSKFPISAAKLVAFTPLSKFEELAFGNHDGVAATLRLSETVEISVVGLHLEVRDNATRLSASKILENIITTASAPTILAGDLNSERSFSSDGNSTIDKLLKIEGIEFFPNLSVPSENNTFPSEYPTRTLDWILVSPNANIIDGEVAKATWSDHLPLLVEISL